MSRPFSVSKFQTFARFDPQWDEHSAAQMMHKNIPATRQPISRLDHGLAQQVAVQASHRAGYLFEAYLLQHLGLEQEARASQSLDLERLPHVRLAPVARKALEGR